MVAWLMEVAATRPILAVVSLASGAALLATIFTNISLRFSLLAAIAIWVAFAGFVWWRGPTERRAEIRRLAAAGVLAGFTATLAYDAARWSLSQLDPAPYNPFEAVRVFGVLLTGSAAESGDALVMTTGIAYHLLNGTTFGLAYALLLGRADAGVAFALVTGTAWGLGLELFQLSVYPGWLDIRAYDEFVRVSFLGHAVYGAALGLGSRAVRRRLARANAREHRRVPTFTGLHER